MDPAAYGAGPVQTFTPHQTAGHVLCCLCGVPIPPNPASMCINCIRTQVDISEGIQKQITVLWCKNCGRYLQPPRHWLRAEPESKELLTYCIKRVKGLQKVKLVDASFIWTEPHSMRLKAKLTVQGEVLNGAILQQSFVVEYVIERHMCTTCNRQNANPNSWVACVQVRQHVAHKRTFMFLEQMILKHNADEACVNVKEMHEGVDFFFANRAHATKFINFLESVVPIRYRHDKQLVSHDVHTSNYNYKYTFSVEIAPICKDDLVCLPHKVATTMGNIGPMVLCTRVTNALTFTDPVTLRQAIVQAGTYFTHPFRAMMSSKQLVEYHVLDTEETPQPANFQQQGQAKFTLSLCELARSADFGANDRTYWAKTHLGRLLQPGDMATGYDTANANLADAEMDRVIGKGATLPDAVLVRKSFEDKRRRRQRKGAPNRAWRLKRMAVDRSDMDDPANGPPRGKQAYGIEQEQQDMERFLQDLEEDADMRARVALYKDPQAAAAAAAATRQPAPSEMGETTDGEEDLPEVPLEELLDDLAALGLEDEEEGEEEGEEDGGGGSDMVE